MVESKKIQDVLKQDKVSVEIGDRLIAYTKSMGFVPDNHGSTEFHKGHYTYEVMKEGTGKKVVPLVPDYKNEKFVKSENQPIIVQDGQTVTMISGRNNPETHDVYNSNVYHVTEGITPGEEDRHILVAFRDFVFSEFAVGVVDANVERPAFKQDENNVDSSGGKDDSSGDGSGSSDGGGGGKA